jgi:hypothetical protein
MLERGEVLGIDLSSRSAGFAYGAPGEKPRLWSVDFMRDGDVHDFYGNLTAYTATVLRDNPIKLVAIEELIAPSAMAGRSNNDVTMTTVGGYAIVIGIIKCKKIPYQPVRVETWRKHFIGIGKLTHIKKPAERRKEGKRLAVQRCRQLGWKVDNDDEADAAGIWDWAGATHMGATPSRLQMFSN